MGLYVGMACAWAWSVFEAPALGSGLGEVGAWPLWGHGQGLRPVAVIVALLSFCLQTLAMSFLPPTGFPAKCQLQRDPLPSGACR